MEMMVSKYHLAAYLCLEGVTSRLDWIMVMDTKLLKESNYHER
jgi:hypothetical protein